MASVLPGFEFAGIQENHRNQHILKCMKSFIRLLIALSLIMPAKASFGQWYGFKGGLNLANMVYSEFLGRIDTKMIPGFQIGATAEYPVNGRFSVETGLQYITRGMFNAELKYTTRLSYIEIPLTVKVIYPFEHQYVYAVFGSYAGIGIGGKLGQKSKDTPIKWGTGIGDDFKRMDFGLCLGAGIEIKSMQYGLTYELGLSNIASNTTEHTKLNRVLSLSAGYRFNFIRRRHYSKR